MVTFDFVIKSELGIHARPAGLLIREVQKYRSAVTFSHDGKQAEGTRLFAIMKLAAREGDTLGVTVEGADEADASAAIKKTLELHF